MVIINAIYQTSMNFSKQKTTNYLVDFKTTRKTSTGGRTGLFHYLPRGHSQFCSRWHLKVTWKNDRLLPIVKFFMKGASFKFNVLMPISVPILAFLLLTVPSSLHRVKWAVTTGAKPITTTLRNAPDTACFQCQVKCQLKHVCMPSKTHG